MDQLQTKPDLNQKICCLKSHEDFIILMEQDYDNLEYIISVSIGNCIIIWNIITKDQVFKSSKGISNIISIALKYPYIAYGNDQDGIVKLFDVQNQDDNSQQILAGSDQLPTSWSLRFKEKIIFSQASGNIVISWDYINNQKLRTYAFANILQQMNFSRNFLLISTSKTFYVICYKRNKKLVAISGQVHPLTEFLLSTKGSDQTIKLFFLMKKMITKTQHSLNSPKIIAAGENLLLLEEDQIIKLNIPTLQQTLLPINSFQQLIIYKNHNLYASNNEKIFIFSPKGL